ncbi:MAG TPA: TonB-dependent receptor [Myxococcales bacterium]|nr:TonB-dependent receptor [Myxococcales bacterium]
MSRAGLIGCIASLAQLSLGAAAVADEPAEEATLDVTVTAARRREVLIESPRAASVLNREEMDRRQARSTPEALLEEPGVFLQRTNYGGGAPFVRGLFGNRILLLVDGIRLNNSTFRAGPNQYLNTVDPLLAERIEVVRGTGSAMHGSDAIGAAINVLSLQPALRDSRTWRADVRASSSSADESAQVGGRLRWSGDRAAAVATGSLRHFDELRGGKDTGVQRFTGYDEWSASAAGTVETAPGLELTAVVQSTRQFDVPRTDRSTPADIRLFSLQERQLAYLRLDADAGGPLSNLRATASFHRQRELADRYRVARDAQERDDNRVGTLGLQVEGQARVAGPLVVGLEGYRDFLASRAARGTISSGTLDGRPELARYSEGVGYQSAGAFAGHRLDLAERFSLHSELRLGAVRVALPADDRLTRLFPGAGIQPLPAHVEVVPVYAAGLHLRWAPAPTVALSGGVSLGFRAPNLDDYARLGAEGGSFLLPTRGLSPERALSGEVDAKLQLPRGAEAGLAYSYTYIADALGRAGASIDGQTVLDGLRVVRVANADSARYHAVEIYGRVPIWNRVAVFGNAAWAHGQVRRQVPAADPSAPSTFIEEPAEKVPPLFGKIGLGWRAAGNAGFAEVLVRFALRQDRLGLSDLTDPRICPDVPGTCPGTPGWMAVTVRAGARLFDWLRLTVAAENLADRSYRMHGSGIDGPGRSVSALLEGSL